MHRRKGCDEPDPEITPQGHQEERRSAMVANGGIASNSSRLLLVRSSARCAIFDLDGRLGGYPTYALIKKNEYYMRRNLMQVYYGTNFGGAQRYTNNPSRN